MDLLAVGYRAILFEAIAPAWKKQLRMPLIQVAIAEKYGRPASEIKVGFQDLNSNLVSEGQYSTTERGAAIKEFGLIGQKVFKAGVKR